MLDVTTAIQLSMTSYTELWLQHMFHHVWGLYRSDGKRPDGVAIVPWKCGQLRVWDATCPDTFAPSYSTIAANQVGAVAQQAEEKNMQKYKHLDSCHLFTPVAIETSGVFGPKTMEFLKGLGHRLRQVSGEANSFAYLTQ